MEKELQNKIVVVTGASKGIGLSIAEAFLEEHVKNIIILDINTEAGIEAMNKLNSRFGEDKVDFFKCDVSHDVDPVFDKILRKYKSFDILVNNAGIVDESSIRRTIDINTIGTIEWTMKFWNHARKDKGGSGGTIITIASIYGFIVDPFTPFYKASKQAVLGFTRTMGHKVNYEQTGVRVIGICPGFTNTALPEEYQIPENLIFQASKMENFMTKVDWQEVDAVSKTAVEVFKNAESGSVWRIEGAIMKELEVPFEYRSEFLIKEEL